MLEKLEFVSEKNSPTIRMTQVFDAPRTSVFEAWTRPEHVRFWWDPSGQPLSACEIDLRPGGAFRWVHQFDGRQERAFSGTYVEIAPPERLVFHVLDGSGSREMRSTILFDEQNGRTTLTMTIECRSIEQRDALLKHRIDIGTARTLENLSRHLQSMV